MGDPDSSGRMEHRMDISFESKEIPIYREYYHQSKRVQESAECVVPDTDADIEKIAAVQSRVYLKSKDLSARGVLVTGELTASVLYIRDGKDSMSSLTVRQPFSIEYETEAPESETLAQVALFVQGTDVRLINPRKIAVGFEVEGELSCYCSEKLRIDSLLPENTYGLHVRFEESSLTLPNAVCEKSVALNEQFSFPTDDPPARLAAAQAELRVADCQLIGTKIIIKGNAEVRIHAFTETGTLPQEYSFSAPYSQIIEVGADSMQLCMVRPEITGAYFDLVDTINGEKALDMELHAVVQIVCAQERTIRCITDAYSNLMPADLLYRTQEYRQITPVRTLELKAEESVRLMEECRELLRVFPSLSRMTNDAGKFGVSVNLDLLMKNAEGELSAGRRTISLTQEINCSEARILCIRVASLSARAEGETVNCSVTLELSYHSVDKKESSVVDGVILDEESGYIQESLPTLTLVRSEGESLWSLAKKYHSSEESILKMNENAEQTKRMLLIPKCI